jgi:FKBP-type peptidyl-prolyl cis-trans isomerase
MYCCKAGGKVFTLSESQSVTVGDGTMILGWDEALKTMAVGEQVRGVIYLERI